VRACVRRYETDLSVARVIMNIASTFHRTLDGSTQFVQQFITAYTVWRDLMFWEKFFWGNPLLASLSFEDVRNTALAITLKYVFWQQMNWP
jgi:hypothetical protein